MRDSNKPTSVGCASRRVAKFSSINMTSVTSLLETPFLTRDPTQQLQIMELGRPLPSLKLASLEIAEGNTIVHSFNAEIYIRNDWICGCADSNSFFCFPCLLFGGDDNWSTSGFNNIQHLGNGISKHELSPVHMSNILNYSKSTRKPKIKQKYSVEEQNKRIEKNLQFLEAIVDCIKLSACNSIPLSKLTEDEENDPLEQLLMFTTSNTSLKNFLQKEPFNRLESMKSDILNAAAEVIRDEIIREIQESEFVSLIVKSGDEDYPRIIILRYVKGHKPIERIWKIIHYENTQRFIDMLLAELRTIISDPNTLISQSYDQLTLKKQDAFIKVFTKVLSYFPQANLVHFYSHDFLDIISTVATIQKHHQNFIYMVWGISEFLTIESSSTKVMPTFEDIRKRFYKEIRKNEAYDFITTRIEAVCQYRRALLETMNTILESPHGYPDVVICQAMGFISMLEDDANIYMLESFFKMVPFFNRCIHEYENCLNPTYYSDPDTIRSILDGSTSGTMNQQFHLLSRPQVLETQDIQVKVENDLEIHDIDLSLVKVEIPEPSTNEQFSCLPTTSKRKIDEEEHESNEKKTERTVKAIQNVMIQLQELLRYRTNMFASQLVDPRNFFQYSRQFPDHLVTTAIGDLHFFSVLDGMKLRNELGVLYARREYQQLTSSCDVFKEILDNNLASTFSETVRLLKFVLTIPSKTDDPKRCFKTRNKVHQFLKDSRWLKNIDCLVYFRCERTLIDNIDGFNSKVINKFLEVSPDAAHFQQIPLRT